MTETQFSALATVLQLSEFDRRAAHAALFRSGSPCVATQNILARLDQADALLRAAYVVHGPMNFRIEVGHRDTSRSPGALSLSIGQQVRLTPRSTERWITVEIDAFPVTASGYYRGIIVEQPTIGSGYSKGDSVEFSEDQVQTDSIHRGLKAKNRFLRRSG